MGRRIGLLVGLVALTSMFALPAGAGNLTGQQWPDPAGSQVALVLVDHTDTTWAGVLGLVGSDWDNGADGVGDVLDLGIGASTAGNDVNNRTVCDAQWDYNTAAVDLTQNAIHFCNSGYGSNGWLGLARVWSEADGTIVLAQALMNDYYLDAYSGAALTNARRHVACQEVGHGLGLDHQKGPRKVSCMNDRWDLTTGGGWNSPNEHDFETLAGLYGTGDTGGGGGGGCNNPRKPGCSQGTSNKHVQDAGNGLTLTTFVVLPPQAQN